MDRLLAPYLIAIAIGSLMPTAGFAADRPTLDGVSIPYQARSVRTRTLAPTPHVRVVCQDHTGRKISCADSARVALQLAYYGACQGCPPVALPPSRYSGYWGW